MAPKTPFSRSIVVGSVPSAIVGPCNRIVSELEANNFSEGDVFAVHLALHEAFLNALKHGNKMDASRGIKIDYSLDADRIEISIADEGNGFDSESVPDPRCGENLYKSEGRGLLLMRSYMDEVRFNERGNCVYLVRHKGRSDLTTTPG
jgi:serine/threonine-protein kinase RsbW